MPVSGEEFMVSAKKMLSSAECTEIDFRNAVSRAYYGLFHLAKSEADRKGWVDYSDGTTHANLSIRYKTNGHPSLAYRITQQHRDRVAADYDAKSEYKLANANKSVEACKALVEEIKNI